MRTFQNSHTLNLLFGIENYRFNNGIFTTDNKKAISTMEKTLDFKNGFIKEITPVEESPTLSDSDIVETAIIDNSITEITDDKLSEILPTLTDEAKEELEDIISGGAIGKSSKGKVGRPKKTT